LRNGVLDRGLDHVEAYIVLSPLYKRLSLRFLVIVVLLLFVVSLEPLPARLRRRGAASVIILVPSALFLLLPGVGRNIGEGRCVSSIGPAGSHNIRIGAHIR